MKKNLLIALFATASMAGAAELQPVATTNGGTVKFDGGTIAGNWTLGISLNTGGLNDMLHNEPGHNIVESVMGAYSGSQSLGQGLFTVKGSGYYQLGDNSRSFVSGIETTFVAGWGNSWYYGLADNGVGQGLQIGVADKGAKINPSSSDDNIYPSGYDMGVADNNNRTFDVYRFDTRDSGGNKATIDSIAPWLVSHKRYTITEANLVVVHSTNGDISTSESDTSITLTLKYDALTLSGRTEQRTAIFTASINDVANTTAGAGSLLGGSAYYDVDNVTEITNINGTLVSSMDIYNQALEVDAGGNIIIPDAPGGDTPGAAVPEPTTATLSLLALAGLCARRRRH